MLEIYVKKLLAASCGGLITLPIDMYQSHIISNEIIILNPHELKYIFFMCNIFALQNYIYEFTRFMNSKLIRGSIIGLIVSPPIIYIKIKKYYKRFELLPIYNTFIFWTTLREVLFYSLIYKLYNLNYPFIKIIAPLIANLIVYPFKIINIIHSYPSIIIDLNIIKKGALIELLKSIIGDTLALYLMCK